MSVKYRCDEFKECNFIPYKSILLMFILFEGIACTIGGQKMQLIESNGAINLTAALAAWENGNINRTHKLVSGFLIDSPTNNEASHLLMKVYFVQGRYVEALRIFDKLDSSYKNYTEAVMLAVEAHIHLKQIELAWGLANKWQLEQSSYLLEVMKKPFSVESDKTYVIPFLADAELPSSYMPGIEGSLNGLPANLRLDTGGSFLHIGKSMAEKYKVSHSHKSVAYHGASKVKVLLGIVDEMKFNHGPVFKNVPVVIHDTIGDFVIFGTNILEQFLTSIDYPNSRFVFTLREHKKQFANHLAMLPPTKSSISFYLWEDHYLFGKGEFGGWQEQNLFFDSGLVAITPTNGGPKQASFSASKEQLSTWGYDKKVLKTTTFISTQVPLSVAGLSQPNTLIWFDKNLKKNRDFGGVRIDGLISHAWLKNYSWTIDFDQHKFIFSTP